MAIAAGRGAFIVITIGAVLGACAAQVLLYRPIPVVVYEMGSPRIRKR